MDELRNKIRLFLDSRKSLLDDIREAVELDYQKKTDAPVERFGALLDEERALGRQKRAAEGRVKLHSKRRARIEKAKQIIHDEEAKTKAECDELEALESRIQDVDKELDDLISQMNALWDIRVKEEKELLDEIQQAGVLPAAECRKERPATFLDNDPKPARRAEQPPTPQSDPDEPNTQNNPDSDPAAVSEFLDRLEAQLTKSRLTTQCVPEVQTLPQTAQSQDRNSESKKRKRVDNNDNDKTESNNEGSNKSKLSRTSAAGADIEVRASGRTIPYDEVFANGQPILNTTIVEFPSNSDRWFILWCQDHTRYFDSLIGAISHLRRRHHKKEHFKSITEEVRRMLVKVLDCTAEKAKINNDAVSYINLD
ncbi:hypothetical protein V8F20_011138 [Naviculisporaceae sp. PSN 640]